MSKIICPECGKVISSYADSCPDCGFPVEKYLKENHLDIINKVCICPKCAMIYGGYGDDDTNTKPLNIKCRFCNCALICTDYTSEFLMEKAHKEYNLGIIIDVAKEYGNNQFSEEAYQHRLDVIKKENAEIDRSLKQRTHSYSSIPHCPTCNSTNIKRISTASKAVGVGLFGLFSKTARSQFECKDCGYKW